MTSHTSFSDRKFRQHAPPVERVPRKGVHVTHDGDAEYSGTDALYITPSMFPNGSDQDVVTESGPRRQARVPFCTWRQWKPAAEGPGIVNGPVDTAPPAVCRRQWEETIGCSTMPKLVLVRSRVGEIKLQGSPGRGRSRRTDREGSSG